MMTAVRPVRFEPIYYEKFNRKQYQLAETGQPSEN